MARQPRLFMIGTETIGWGASNRRSPITFAADGGHGGCRPTYTDHHMETTYDAIIVGSGFGGAMAAHQLVRAGRRVLMLERGGWVHRGPENWGLRGPVDLTPHYDKSSALRVETGGNKPVMGLYACVGGPSVFYGGVSFRFREQDFRPPASIVGASGAEWPFGYDTLEPYYAQAEQLLRIAGDDQGDPTAPPRRNPFPQAPAPLAGISRRVGDAAREQGLHPFPLPLAIEYGPGERTCIQCATCDTFACAIRAKNDLATTVLPELMRQGMTLRADTVVTGFELEQGRIRKVNFQDRNTGSRGTASARQVILAAGALGTPHLLLSAGLERHNPGGAVVGRYLMRHTNTIVFGIFPGRADPERRFHKQLAILDHYFGHPDHPALAGKIGSLQQVPTPPRGLVQHEIPGWPGRLLSKGVDLLTGLLAIAEDQPQFDNALTVDPGKRDAFGLPQPVIRHQYSGRDLSAVAVLAASAKRILRKAGAVATYVHPIRTFSHTVGTVRMGTDPTTSALDPDGNFRGIDNLFVVDGSFMPSSAALNPSLTIAANALRIGALLAGRP